MKPDADLVAGVVAAAARHLGLDPSVMLVPSNRNGRGKVRQLAGAALIARGLATHKGAGATLGLHPIQLSPSQLLRAGITQDDVRVVAACLPAPDGDARPIVLTRRGDPDYVDPRRDLAREARILAARLNGAGPRVIAEAEGVAPGLVVSVLQREVRRGAVLPPLKCGRPARAHARAARTGPAKPPAPKAPKAQATRAAKPAPLKPAPAREPFPDHHPAWSPLPDSAPVRLIDHDKGCRWPVTVEGRTQPMVCNLPAEVLSPYCARHAWLAASPAIRSGLPQPCRRPASAVAVRAETKQ